MAVVKAVLAEADVDVPLAKNAVFLTCAAGLGQVTLRADKFGFADSHLRTLAPRSRLEKFRW